MGFFLNFLWGLNRSLFCIFVQMSSIHYNMRSILFRPQPNPSICLLSKNSQMCYFSYFLDVWCKSHSKIGVDRGNLNIRQFCLIWNVGTLCYFIFDKISSGKVFTVTVTISAIQRTFKKLLKVGKHCWIFSLICLTKHI